MTSATFDALILAIETSTPVTRVVVIDRRTGLRRAAAEAVAERHSSNLLRLCADVTRTAGVSIADLGAIACGAGPGSFTGLRVGLAVAKGLAMPTGVALVLVSSLEALALDMLPRTAPGDLMLPCLDAGKGQIFAALFGRRGEASADVVALTEEWALLPEALIAALPTAALPTAALPTAALPTAALPTAALPINRSIVYSGTGAVRYRSVLEVGLGDRGRFLDVVGPSADAVGRRAIARLARGESDDLATAVPSYGRAPDITRPKRPPMG